MAVARTTWPPPGAMPAPRSGRPSEGFELADVIRVVRHRRSLILAVTAACVGLTALVLMLLPTMYSASAEVMLDPRKNNVAEVSSVLSSLPTDPASVQNQIQILTSRDLASEVVNKLGLNRDPEFNRSGAGHDQVVNAFARHLSVENEGLSTAINITFKARSPEKAAHIANTVAETYVQSQLEGKLSATRDATAWLEGRVRDLAKQVQSSDAAVEQYKAEHNLSEASEGVPLIDQQISALSTQLVQAKADFAQKQATFSRVQALMKAGHGGELSQVVASPLIIQLRSQEADLIRSEAELATKYGPKHPKLIAVESQKHDLDQKIGDEVSRLEGSLASDASVARAQLGTLQASLTQAEQEAQKQNLLRVKLKSLEANAASAHSIYDAFVARLRALQDQNSIEASDARVISHAAPPVSPSSPKRGLVLGASLPASLLLGLLLALVLERFAPSETPNRPQQRRLPVLATISGIAHPRAADLVLDWPAAPYAQAIQRLASDIVEGAALGSAKSILVTSSHADGGAATVAISVGRAAAQLGRRVIVLDANLLEPGIAAVLGTSLKHDLDEVLAGQAPLSKAMLKDRRTNLLLLAPAQSRADGERVFASHQFAQLIQHLRNSCDLLLTIAPPVFTNGTLEGLAQFADSVMLVTSANSESGKAEAAAEALDNSSGRPVGMVLAA